MRILVVAIGALIIGLGGCQTPVAPRMPTTLPAAAAPVVVSGQGVALTLKSQTPEITVTYEGVVKQADAETITIENAKRITRRDEQPPSGTRLPLVDRRRRNSGVASEPLPGAVTLQRSDLASLNQLPAAVTPTASSTGH